MKKIILASVALIAVFASCKKEDIRTVYETKAAEATINVYVFDAYLGTDVTDANVTASAGQVEGNTKVVIKGNKAIAKQTVTITATSQDGKRTGSYDLPVEALVEGGVATYSCKVVIGKAKTGDKEYQLFKKYAGQHYEFGYLLKSYDHYYEDLTHGTGLNQWCVNNTEFCLFGETTYTETSGTQSIATIINHDAGISEAEELLIDEYKESKDIPYVTKEVNYSYFVSAFSYFNVKVKYDVHEYIYLVQRRNILEGETFDEWEDIATITKTDYDYTSIERFEIPSPSHASHYVHGHGVDDPVHSHGHGQGGQNAGGGIVVAD